MSPSRESEARAILKSVWGYDDFRPGQWEVIAAALDGRDVFAVMPTGSGKSMCYQLPALVAGGLTLVTTEKDFARIEGNPALAAHAMQIVSFPVTLRIEDEGALEDFLKDRLRRARQDRQ